MHLKLQQYPSCKANSYVKKLLQIKKQSNDIQIMESIEKFKITIKNTQIISQLFEKAIVQIPEKVFLSPYGQRYGILFKNTIDEALELLNIAIQIPPQFSQTQKCGLPINLMFADLLNTHTGTILFSRFDVNEYLKEILDDYGLMLKSEKSLKYMNSDKGGWLSQQASAFINYDQYVCDKTKPHFGFKCWNDWFIRDLVEEARPIYQKDDPFVIINSSQNYPLTIVNTPVANVKGSDQFWLKQNCYSLYDMFEAQKSGVKQIIDESFVGGTVYQGFLSLMCYHQWHSPVSGVIQRSYRLPGCYFLKNPNINIIGQNNFVASQVFFSCVATRHVFIINTQNQAIGRVAIIQIGMGQVSSCVPIVKEGQKVVKGQRIGRFEFGGSSHVMVFDRRAKLKFNPSIYEREIIDEVQSSKIQKVNSWLAKVLL